MPDSAWKTLPCGLANAGGGTAGACQANGPLIPRARPDNVKERIVRQKGFENLRLLGEEVAEFEHMPQACRRSYRMVVVRKRIAVERGQEHLFTDYRYLFYITNDRVHVRSTIVETAHARCDQENLIDQLKHGVHALTDAGGGSGEQLGVHGDGGAGLVAEGVVGALLLPAEGRWKERHKQEKQSVLRMEFKRFVNAFVRVPAAGGPRRAARGIQTVVVEPVAERPVACGGRAAMAAALLTSSPGAGVRMPRLA